LAALAASACGTLKGKAAAPAPAPPVAQSAPAAAAAEPPSIRPAAAARASCVPKGLPRAPKYPDTDAALRDAGGAADRYQLMAAGRLLRSHRLAELEKVVDGCR
jgi:hypothetical protein